MISTESLSELFKRRRKEIEWSAKDVCDSIERNYGIKIAPSTLYGYENGHRQPDLKTAFALFDLYDLGKDMMAAFGYSTDSKLKKQNLKKEIHKLIGKLNCSGIEKAYGYIVDLSELEKYTYSDEPPAEANSIPIDIDLGDKPNPNKAPDKMSDEKKPE